VAGVVHVVGQVGVRAAENVRHVKASILGKTSSYQSHT
jgi:hypothetical protein